jgi:hypothetical protein
VNESLAKLMRRALPGMPRKQYKALKRALSDNATSGKLRGLCRKAFERTIAKAKARTNQAPKSSKIPSALNRFFPSGVIQ